MSNKNQAAIAEGLADHALDCEEYAAREMLIDCALAMLDLQGHDPECLCHETVKADLRIAHNRARKAGVFG